nr:PREDICTED: carbonic anhydrase 4-like isoform X1 [Paralichthys olivaceus]XP_019962608.1 PREDICTED: carbonic anhydrase 4-like isoform X1 [Paralichthys olivaceus]XP_019962609.1 PREDICTED: carbonic anhydrase 4-like isoform X1 [Paralichthys olivaceus]
MCPSSLVLWLSLGALIECAAGSDWCYTGCAHSPTHWGDISSFCRGQRQSPIDIDTSHVQRDPNLLDFTFKNFSSQDVLKSITNNGHTVVCLLKDNEVEVSGGGLNGTYSTLQFHFHWGDTAHHPGSEHTIDKLRYPVEMHIVSLKKGLTKEQAVANPEGIAVLGFFLNATEDGNMTGPWGILTSYLMSNINTEIAINHSLSIDDLIGSVSRTKYYRYMGSLTTPNCSEAVVWTVFQEPININKNLIERFASITGLTNVYRPVQELNGRQVFASPEVSLPPSGPWCYDNHCIYNQSRWHLLSPSHCGGENQSPINIESKKAVLDKQLNAFTFTKFDDKHTIKYITNTGHAVKCVLKENTVEISGGGLGHVYSTLQFHFHWGSTVSKGSEHMVDSKRYSMEMHIVNKRKDLTLDEAVQTSNGLAVLGFFIEAESTKSSSGSGQTNPTPSPAADTGAWKKLTNYLSAIEDIDSKVNFTEEISIDDLLSSVSKSVYYRYNGSLTTPGCNEAVVWTVFKESIKVDQKLMMLFPTQMKYNNVYRAPQALQDRTVYTSAAASCLAPIMQFLLPACLFTIVSNLHI